MGTVTGEILPRIAGWLGLLGILGDMETKQAIPGDAATGKKLLPVQQSGMDIRLGLPVVPQKGKPMTDTARVQPDPLMVEMVRVLADLAMDACPCGHGGLTSVWEDGKMIAMTCHVNDCRFTRWVEEKSR